MVLNLQSKCPKGVTLSAFVDSELPEREQGAIRQHLVYCSDCRQAVDEMEALVVKLQSIPKVSYEVKIDLSRQTHQPRKRASWQVAAAVAAIVAVAGYAAYTHIASGLTQERLIETYMAEHTMGQILHVQSFGLYGN